MRLLAVLVTMTTVIAGPAGAAAAAPDPGTDPPSIAGLGPVNQDQLARTPVQGWLLWSPHNARGPDQALTVRLRP